MINLSDLITEKLEIPGDLKKQLENTTYSAIGYLITPYLLKKQKSLIDNKKLNDEIYNKLKEIFDSILKLTKSKKSNNTKLTFPDVLVPDYFSVWDTESNVSKETITVTKSNDEIFVESNKHKTGNFPSFYILDDGDGLYLDRFKKAWNEYNTSYIEYLSEFDDNLVKIQSLINKLTNWKSLDTPKKPKIHPDNQKMKLVYEKYFNEKGYDHYFRFFSGDQDTYVFPHYFLSAYRPFIVQTIYLKSFIQNKKTTTYDEFIRSVNDSISTAYHEGRHLLQYRGIDKDKTGDWQYGTPKRKLRFQYNPSIRGKNVHGSKVTSDDLGRVSHLHQTAEFKTNLYEYKNIIEQMLGKYYSRKNWKGAFKSLILYSINKLSYSTFIKTFPFEFDYHKSYLKTNLEMLYTEDRPKFNQYIKELYKLIFD